jgi:hypothetical protein
MDVTVSLAAQAACRAAAHAEPGFELTAWVVPPREIHPPVPLLDDPRPLGRLAGRLDHVDEVVIDLDPQHLGTGTGF